MSTLISIKQTEGVGVARQINPKHQDCIVILLRLIERLPILSEPSSEEMEFLERQIQTIHQNHQELAALAAELLLDART